MSYNFPIGYIYTHPWHSCGEIRPESMLSFFVNKDESWCMTFGNLESDNELHLRDFTSMGSRPRALQVVFMLMIIKTYQMKAIPAETSGNTGSTTPGLLPTSNKGWQKIFRKGLAYMLINKISSNAGQPDQGFHQLLTEASQNCSQPTHGYNRFVSIQHIFNFFKLVIQCRLPISVLAGWSSDWWPDYGLILLHHWLRPLHIFAIKVAY